MKTWLSVKQYAARIGKSDGIVKYVEFWLFIHLKYKDKKSKTYRKLPTPFLVPAIFNTKISQPEMAGEKYWIRKNNIKIIEAWKIGENDMEYMAIRGEDNLILPK